MSRSVCIIPARMASSRFPGKPLKPLLGHALILHVLDRCQLCKQVDLVVVATCDDEIRSAVEAHGGKVTMTADTHPGCVDRTEEAAVKLGLGDEDFVLMVQGDEVLVDPAMTDAVIAAYRETGADVVNLASRIRSAQDHDDPNNVKVVADPKGRAIYFSRSAIPSRVRSPDVPMYQQTGIIGFRRDFLRRFGGLSRTPLEVAEGIDMMRTLEHGYPIQMVFTDQPTIGVDTIADLHRAESVLKTDPVTAQYWKIKQ
jgi:3-deoxy-manno-octulosonate cytidylyltransferase (CMP-KDO synthetase)